MLKRWLNRWKIGKMKQLSLRLKVIASFAVIIAVVAAGAIYNLQRVELIQERFSMQNATIDKKITAMQLKEMAQQLDVLANGLSISGDLSIEEKYAIEKEAFLDLVDKVGESASNREQRKWRAQMTTAAGEFADNFYQISRIIKDGSLTEEERSAKLKQLYTMSQAHKTYIFEMADQFIRVFSGEADSAVTESRTLLEQTVNVLIFAIFVVVAVSLFITTMFIRSFVGPIRRLQKAVRHLADGDLRNRIGSSSTDELGSLSRSFDEMSDQMTAMLLANRQIASSMKELSSMLEGEVRMTAVAGADILKAMDEISSGADQQASQAEFSASGITELKTRFSEISSITDTMLLMSENTKNHTRHGAESVELLKSTSSHTERQLSHMAASLDALTNSSKQIGLISSAIEEITRQTNLLAINASIEAAHAGVHGRGFAVIAAQVRELSDEAKESSRQIFEMIHSLQEKISDVQSDMSETSRSIHEQNTAIGQTASAFSVIEDSAETLSVNMGEIHGKVQDAIEKNDTVVESVHTVSAIAEETAAGVQEVGAATNEQDRAIRRIAEQAGTVNELAEQLFAQISRFKMD